MLALPNGDAFTRGVARFYDEAPGGAEGTAKIYVKIEPQGLGAPVLAQLDTGSPYLVLEREIAEALELLQRDGEPLTLSTRVGSVDGHLERAIVRLVADAGDSLEIDATVFVSPDWQRGNFIGYTGLLERVRFAVDPQQNAFHFGPAD